ncbi:MAG: T9SS type A sorting domain-containing protein [Calditrichae bacterium]|nr:T9SS type A sorting domain-containing protein [Calditrichia bacterium]
MYTFTSRILWMIFLSAFLLYADEWKNGTYINEPRAGASALTWNGKIYLFGGKSINNSVLNTVEVYDPASNSWTSNIVAPFRNARYNASAVVWDNKFYLIGGRDIDDVFRSVEVYDPVQNTWQEAHELRTEREGHTSVVFNNRIYTIGGQKSNFDLVEEIEWYDSQEQKWEKAAFDIYYPRSALFSAVYNEQFYMFGGYYYGLSATACKAYFDGDIYDWEITTSLAEPRAYGATAVIDSLIYIIGGETATGKTNLVEIYNVNTGKISRGEDMNMSHSGMASAVLNNKIFSIGGYESTGNYPINHVHILETNVTALEDPSILPTEMLLAKTYPNPFNGQVRIEVDLPMTGNVIVEVLNSTGQKIRQILSSTLSAGKNTLQWDAKDSYGNTVVSGIYFVRISYQNHNRILKLLHVK